LFGTGLASVSVFPQIRSAPTPYFATLVEVPGYSIPPGSGQKLGGGYIFLIVVSVVYAFVSLSPSLSPIFVFHWFLPSSLVFSL
jgi:hypothetical protein